MQGLTARPSYKALCTRALHSTALTRPGCAEGLLHKALLCTACCAAWAHGHHPMGVGAMTMAACSTTMVCMLIIIIMMSINSTSARSACVRVHGAALADTPPV
jgi:hypothetical protein